MIKVVQEREKCIGCGACAAACPSTWEMSEDGKSTPLKADFDELGCNMEAATSCPVNCIHVEKDGEKLI